MIKKPFLGYYSFRDEKVEFKKEFPYSFEFPNGKLLADFQDFGTLVVFLSGAITNPLKANSEKFIYDCYFEKGLPFLNSFDGEFLIFIYDKAHKSLEIFNNPYESTDFYYYKSDDLFIFADSLTRLIEYLPVKVFDKKSIPTFLSVGFSSSEKMPLSDVYRLLPSQHLHIDDKGITMKNSWKKLFIFNRKPFKDLDKKIDEYEALFQKNIRNFLKVSKTKSLGMFLSGGSDTSFVYFESSKIYKKQIHTFTATYEGFGFDESPKAKAVTKMRNGIHHRVLISAKDLDLIPEVVKSCEEPLAGSTLAFFILAKEASKYVDTIFTGDPGDTLWGEYYPVAEWHRYLSVLPYPLRSFMHKLSRMLLYITDWERLWEVEHLLSLFDTSKMYDNFMQRLCTYRHFRDDQLKKLLNFSLEKNRCSIKINFDRHNFHDALVASKMLYGAYFYNITMSQKHVESSGMNFFAPYLSKEIINFINSLPEDWINGGSSIQKLTNTGIKRRFHKEALLRYLPKRYVYGLQQSFDVPWHALFRMRPKILKNLLKRLNLRGWYNHGYLKTLFDEFPKQNVKPYEINELKHHGYRIYCLLVFEIWYTEFIENSGKRGVSLEKYLEI